MDKIWTPTSRSSVREGRNYIFGHKRKVRDILVALGSLRRKKLILIWESVRVAFTNEVTFELSLKDNQIPPVQMDIITGI